MDKEKFKKNIMFIFTFYFPVGILVYYFENFYFICISQLHYFRPPAFQTFILGDLAVNFGFFLSFFFINCTIKPLEKKIKNKYFLSFVFGFFIATAGTLFELIVGSFFLNLFNMRLWNYSELAFNYKGIIAPSISFVFFVLGYFYFLFGYNYVLKFKKLWDEIIFEKVMKNKKLLVLISLVWIIYIGDIFYNWYQMYFWENNLENKKTKYHPWPKYAEVVHNYKN